MKREKQFPNIEAANPISCISRKIMKCHRLVGQVFRKYILPFGITNSQCSILFVLSKKQDVKQVDLVNMLALEKSSVSRNLRRLLEQEYVVKGPVARLNITEKGKELLEEIIPEWEKAMAEVREKIKEEGEEALNLILGSLVAKP